MNEEEMPLSNADDDVVDIYEAEGVLGDPIRLAVAIEKMREAIRDMEDETAALRNKLVFWEKYFGFLREQTRRPE